MERTKNAVRNGITGMINKTVVMLFPFIIKTILIKKLGVEYLGLKDFFTSILQILNVIELGFTSAVVFCMYKPIAQDDKDMICALMNFYKKIYRIIGIVILIIGLLITPFIEKLISGTYPNEINIYILYFIYLFNTVITYFLFSYKNILLTAHQRNDVSNSVNAIVFAIQYIIQIIILLVYKNYYLFIIANTFTVISNNIICAKIVSKKYPEYICKGDIDKNTKKDLRRRVYGMIIQEISAVTRNSLDSIYISAFLGLEIVAIYGNYHNSIMLSVIDIMSILTTSIVAGIGNSIAIESIDKNYDDMNKFNFIYMWLGGWASICLLCLTQPFMQLWLGEQYMFPFSVVICLCLYFYTLKMGTIRIVYSDAAGLWWENRYRAIIEAISNIILKYIFIRLFGIYGIIIGTLISFLVINFGYGSRIIFKSYFKGKSILKYFKSNLIYATNTFIVAIITYLICCLLPKYGIISIIARGIVCLIIPNIYYLMVYKNNKIFKEAVIFIKNATNKIPLLNKIFNKILEM